MPWGVSTADRVIWGPSLPNGTILELETVRPSLCSNRNRAGMVVADRGPHVQGGDTVYRESRAL